MTAPHPTAPAGPGTAAPVEPGAAPAVARAGSPHAAVLLSSQLVFNLGFYAVVPFLAVVMRDDHRVPGRRRDAGVEAEPGQFVGEQRGCLQAFGRISRIGRDRLHAHQREEAVERVVEMALDISERSGGVGHEAEVRLARGRFNPALSPSSRRKPGPSATGGTL